MELSVPKANEISNFCSDSCKVNAATKVDQLKQCWQVPLMQHASEISVFVTSHHFCSIEEGDPFRMRNTPVTFQRLRNIGLGEIRNCEIQVVDIMVYLSN